jgi:hypothetical protein
MRFVLAIGGMVAILILLAGLATSLNIDPKMMFTILGVFAGVSLLFYGLIKLGFFKALQEFGKEVSGAGAATEIGKGLATVWGAERSARKTFEWQKHSLFLIPRQSLCQLSNAQGDKPARLVSYNYLPPAVQAVGDPEFFFNNPYVSSQEDGLENFYSEAKAQWSEGYYLTCSKTFSCR